MSREGTQRRWRFEHPTAPLQGFGGSSSMRVIEVEVEVEVEPTDGIYLASGRTWAGVHVKAHYPMVKDRRWHRGNLLSATTADTAAIEATAAAIMQKVGR